MWQAEARTVLWINIYFPGLYLRQQWKSSCWGDLRFTREWTSQKQDYWVFPFLRFQWIGFKHCFRKWIHPLLSIHRRRCVRAGDWGFHSNCSILLLSSLIQPGLVTLVQVENTQVSSHTPLCGQGLLKGKTFLSLCQALISQETWDVWGLFQDCQTSCGVTKYFCNENYEQLHILKVKWSHSKNYPTP